MRVFKFMLVLFMAGELCGCYIYSKKDELSTMGAYSRDKNNQQRIVDQTNAHYDALVAAIDSGDISHYLDQSSIKHSFGEPILIRSTEVDGQKMQLWLYRYAIASQAKDKVYLYFDSQGRLVRYGKEKVQW